VLSGCGTYRRKEPRCAAQVEDPDGSLDNRLSMAQAQTCRHHHVAAHVQREDAARMCRQPRFHLDAKVRSFCSSGARVVLHVNKDAAGSQHVRCVH